MLRDTHLKININHLEHNINEIQSFVGPNVIVGAVIKANAYGHGAKYISKILYEAGVNYFLVATLVEAIQLRQSNKDYNILIMGHTPNDYLQKVIEYDLIPTIFSLEQAELLNEMAAITNQKIPIHLKIETGFNRLGLQINDQTLAIIRSINQMKHLMIEGAFTHLTLKGKETDSKQFNDFLTLMKTLDKENIHIPIKHICDSIGMVLYPEFHLNMVRVGAILYGLQSEERGVLNIKEVLSFHTKLSYTKQLKKGESISYGNRWIATKDTTIGTLPFGYADGYPREMYQKATVVIKQKTYPIVGVICMDQCMVDLGDDIIDMDEMVTIFGKEGVSIEKLAQLSVTNKNDIVSRYTSRVPRVYEKDGKPYYIENELLR